MEITYNSKYDYNSTSYLTFTEIPNILKVKEYIDGTRASLSIEIQGNLKSTVSGDGQYYVTVLGETISSVMEYSNAKNKRFYISSDANSTAFSMAQAFRNCASLSANFTIIHTGNTVNFLARNLGGVYSVANPIATNIPNTYITMSSTNGTVNSDLYNGKITVDVYKDTTDVTDYVTTLEKNFYGSECAFDVSPVLATLSEYGKTTPYTFKLNMVRGSGSYAGDWSYLGSVSGYSTIGYHCNQSEKMLEIDGVQMLMHNYRGDTPIVRYVYENSIPFSTLITPNTTSWVYSISCKDSRNQEIWNSGNITDRPYISDTLIQDREVQYPSELENDAQNDIFYVDLTLGGNTYRFNVIKPLKATEYSQRVEWRNEYGGISFFDFTSDREESDSVKITTYEKNVFDYHDMISEFEKKKIYKNDYDKTVKLTTHLMEENGRWIFNSLMMSKSVWTYINGNKYYIIPQSINVKEDSTYNNIFTAELTYTYSDI